MKRRMIEPHKEDIFGYENHYYHPGKTNRYASLEKIISILRGLEKGEPIPKIDLIKYISEENPGEIAYDLKFPLYNNLSKWDGGHHRILAGKIGKYPLEINELEENLEFSKIPEEYKTDFGSMDIRSNTEIIKKGIGKYDFPKEIENAEKIPTPYEISKLLMEKENKRINSDDLISLYFN